MVKLSGGSRVLKTGSKNYSAREAEYNKLMLEAKFSAGYFSKNGGGYYVIEHSPAKHKPEEIEAARLMANKGYIITLKDESGSIKTPDGYVFSAGFEQSTPFGGSVTNFKNCLEHARDKPDATAAVVYMKNSTHTKETVREGIKRYSEHNSKKLTVYVVSKKGNIHRWRTHE